MRVPARTATKAAVRQRVSSMRSLPAPIGGWNARDPLPLMKATDAIKLENWFPRVSDCAIRGGCEDHVTGFSVRPKTLMQYNSPAGTNAMFAVTAAGIYNVTSAGAVGAAVKSCTNGYLNWLQMGVSGGHYLISANGVDKPIYYDGTTWTSVDGASTPALTGVTTTGLVFPFIYKRRLFFLEDAKLNFWYLAADAVGGALTQFLLGPLCKLGGYAMAAANWSFDGGDGPDDYLAIVTSEGEVLVFNGTNPSSAADWLLQGVYFVGKPLGRKCFTKLAGDLILLTELGAFPLSKALQSATVDYKLALTNKIEGAFISSARTYGSNVGWTGTLYPAQGALIFNVPTADGGVSAEQYVMNTTTKSWCKFTGWNASDLIVFDRELYFIDADKIAKAWLPSTFSDYGNNIVADAQGAYSYFGSQNIKKFLLFRPVLLVNGNLTFSSGIAIDFDSTPTLNTSSYSVTSGGIFDVDDWDDAYWAAGLEVQQSWQTPAAWEGRAGSALLRIATNLLEIQWAASDFVYEQGHGL